MKEFQRPIIEFINLDGNDIITESPPVGCHCDGATCFMFNYGGGCNPDCVCHDCQDDSWIPED